MIQSRTSDNRHLGQPRDSSMCRGSLPQAFIRSKVARLTSSSSEKRRAPISKESGGVDAGGTEAEDAEGSAGVGVAASAIGGVILRRIVHPLSGAQWAGSGKLPFDGLRATRSAASPLVGERPPAICSRCPVRGFALLGLVVGRVVDGRSRPCPPKCRDHSEKQRARRAFVWSARKRSCFRALDERFSSAQL